MKLSEFLACACIVGVIVWIIASHLHPKDQSPMTNNAETISWGTVKEVTSTTIINNYNEDTTSCVIIGTMDNGEFFTLALNHYNSTGDCAKVHPGSRIMVKNEH